VRQSDLERPPNIRDDAMGTNRSFSEGSLYRPADYDISQDTIVNYVGTHYVRVLKRFEAPANYPEKTIEARLMKPAYNRTFHLRYYLPKFTLVRKTERVRQIVIMFNGLNELDHFDLYDFLGEYLAERGIAAVLLPTPYHLNRRAGRDSKTPRLRPHVQLFKKPMLMYYNYKQSMHETALLIRKLKGKARDENDLAFYESLFDPDLQVSILGFSLGGLRALASLILQPDDYYACIVFNSGGSLDRVNTKRININNRAWVRFVKDLHTASKKPPEGAGLEDSEIWRAFEQVYLGSHSFPLKNSLRDHCDQLLFILSGADSTVPPDVSQLEVEGHGLNVFRVGGVDHIPTLDPKWSFWLDRVSEVIVGFIGQAGQKRWSAHGIVSEIASALKDPSYAIPFAEPDAKSPPLEDFLNEVEPSKREDVIRAYYAGMAYYPRFRDVLKKVAKSFEHAKKAKHR
jgi:hypothetical protein